MQITAPLSAPILWMQILHSVQKPPSIRASPHTDPVYRCFYAQVRLAPAERTACYRPNVRTFQLFRIFRICYYSGEGLVSATLIDPVSIPKAQENQIRDLRRLVQEGGAIVGPDERQIEIPESVHELLLLILNNLQAGRAISIVAEHQQLTTQRAADILGVSRPFLVRLLENGEIPFYIVGSPGRIYLRDLLQYKHQHDAARHETINKMARAEMEAGTYDKVILPDGAEDE
jgi:excisionase family DNA binding protein